MLCFMDVAVKYLLYGVAIQRDLILATCYPVEICYPVMPTSTE